MMVKLKLHKIKHLFLFKRQILTKTLFTANGSQISFESDIEEAPIEVTLYLSKGSETTLVYFHKEYNLMRFFSLLDYLK